MAKSRPASQSVLYVSPEVDRSCGQGSLARCTEIGRYPGMLEVTPGRHHLDVQFMPPSLLHIETVRATALTISINVQCGVPRVSYVLIAWRSIEGNSYNHAHAHVENVLEVGSLSSGYTSKYSANYTRKYPLVYSTNVTLCIVTVHSKPNMDTT